ncbi:MAG: ATP-binding protein [Chloroflexi bacterium]|nr:ATP-binding protein [Chloroflexota bacterium]
MLYSPTLEKLRAPRLDGMVPALEEQRQPSDITRLDFEERLALLVERQWLWKENRALAARLQRAQLKIPSACLEDIDYASPRGLKRGQIDQLRAGEWLKPNRHCIVTGPTGGGKTYLGCALGQQACRDGHRTIYYYAPKLFRGLQQAQADGSLTKLLKSIRKARLLIVDDPGIASVGPKQYRDFLEILDDRNGSGSTIITSQFPVAQGHDMIADDTVADAILDRLVHKAYRLELKGESLRKSKTPAQEHL